MARIPWEEHLNGAAVYHRETDPFKDWLESCAHLWDRARSRLAELLPDCLGAVARDVLHGQCSGQTGPNARSRAAEPTTQAASCERLPILIGPQRAGKSQLLSNLLPPENPDWFSDSVCVSDPTQKRVDGNVAAA